MNATFCQEGALNQYDSRKSFDYDPKRRVGKGPHNE